MFTIKTDLIFNGKNFNSEFLHNGKGECPYCFLNFMHQHPRDSKINEFIMVNLPKSETWEERFDRNFIQTRCADCPILKDITCIEEIKSFIRKEFI